MAASVLLLRLRYLAHVSRPMPSLLGSAQADGREPLPVRDVKPQYEDYTVISAAFLRCMYLQMRDAGAKHPEETLRGFFVGFILGSEHPELCRRLLDGLAEKLPKDISEARAFADSFAEKLASAFAGPPPGWTP